jgi:copper/silver efflux system protein
MAHAASPLARLIRFCLENKLIVLLLLVAAIAWGIIVAPFNWNFSNFPRSPVPVDAIPDLGENQQIVFTRWPGRSPRDVEDQITYPLTVALLSVPGVKTVRSSSNFGYSSLFILFKEEVDFYWARSRILEKLASLPPNALPEGVAPVLGPDATALGQVFWYTLEGRDTTGAPTGGWDLDEIRSVQDWYVRYALQSVDGISEVASIGGFVKEYQVDVDPDAMRAYGVTLDEVISAVKNSNIDVGARTLEINSVEYIVRGKGFLTSVQDLEETAVLSKGTEGVPVYLKNIAHISLGPALRRGALDKKGAEVVGGGVVTRYGENPLATIDRVKDKIREITPGLPTKILADGTISKLTIVPFYDRTDLIHETLQTLNKALTEEILITSIVILVMALHLESSFLIAALLPLSVLICFIFMKLFNVDANIVALSGIAIAIGTVVDMGIVLCENIVRNLNAKEQGTSNLEVIYNAGGCPKVNATS